MQSPGCSKNTSLKEGKEKLKWSESNNPVLACHNSGEIDKNWDTMRFCKQGDH